MFNGGGQWHKLVQPHCCDLIICAVSALIEGLGPRGRVPHLLQRLRDRLTLRLFIVEAPKQGKPLRGSPFDQVMSHEADTVARAIRAIAAPLAESVTYL